MFFRGISTLPRSSWEILPGQLSSQIRSKKCKYLRKNITLTWINHDVVYFTCSCMQGLFYELPQTSSILDLVEDENSLKKLHHGKSVRRPTWFIFPNLSFTDSSSLKSHTSTLRLSFKQTILKKQPNFLFLQGRAQNTLIITFLSVFWIGSTCSTLLTSRTKSSFHVGFSVFGL